MVDEEEQELELDVNEKKGGKKTVILIVVAVLLVNALGIAAWMFLGQSDEGKGKQSSDKKEKQEIAGKPIKYLTMVPEFIVNFGPGSKVRYLQVDLQISTREEDLLKIISAYRPVLRNDILVVLSGVSYEDLRDRAGKEVLQKKLLNTINKVVVAAQSQTPANDEEAVNTDEPVEGPIENVFYTSFIMQ